MQIFDPLNLKELDKLEGRRSKVAVGSDISFNKNTGYSEQIWYTSTDPGGEGYQFNTILAY